MKEQYHILNGDCLKEQFPKDIQGSIIVLRECLVDGNVKGATLEDFFENRATFICEFNEGATKESYFKKVVSEFNKIKKIPNNAEINLWFEDDLFCQVNFWFTNHLLIEFQKSNPIFLVRPKIHTRYGFGGLDKTGLQQIFENRTALIKVDIFQKLWKFYQNSDSNELLKTARNLESRYPFIVPAVMAHLDRLPNTGGEGRPTQVLKQIMKELDTIEFDPVFQEFNKRESIYGYGDLQVKRLFDQIIKPS